MVALSSPRSLMFLLGTDSMEGHAGEREPDGSPDAGEKEAGHLLLVPRPVLLVLFAAAVLVAHEPVDIHHPEIRAVAHWGPGEDVRGARARYGPAYAHDQVADVVEVPRQCPPAGSEEVVPLLGFDVVHWPAPDLVGRQVPTLGDVGPEPVLLDVGEAEQYHAYDVEEGADRAVHGVVGERDLLVGDVVQEADGIIHRNPAEAPEGQHPAVQVVPDVRGRQVRRLVPVVIKHVVEVRRCDHPRRPTDAPPAAHCVAHRLTPVQPAVEVHGR
mmetsp:Transcript_81746/g.231693  ORF Transcript_81746/g.231693 Transcript_81746/m.231693 type:complete len:271 (+) Transcript_81746:310-1122(+)